MSQLGRFFNKPMDQLSTKQLERLLFLPLVSASEKCVNIVNAAVDELFRRKGLDTTFPPIDVDRAWADFKKHYMHHGE